MRRRRERHGRGLRGPLALPNPLGPRAQPPRPAGAEEFFARAVASATERIHRQCPRVLAGVNVGVEDVPHLQTAWSGNQVPLAAAIEATAGNPAQVVVYRRPLERRAASRKGLRILVYRTIVEQIAALTGVPVSEIDPDGLADEDEWD